MDGIFNLMVIFNDRSLFELENYYDIVHLCAGTTCLRFYVILIRYKQVIDSIDHPSTNVLSLLLSALHVLIYQRILIWFCNCCSHMLE